MSSGTGAIANVEIGAAAFSVLDGGIILMAFLFVETSVAVMFFAEA